MNVYHQPAKTTIYNPQESVMSKALSLLLLQVKYGQILSKAFHKSLSMAIVEIMKTNDNYS